MKKENIIKGHCKTNLDHYEVHNIQGFAIVPNEGDSVKCKFMGEHSSLRVCHITHDFRDNEPYIIVELHH